MLQYTALHYTLSVWIFDQFGLAGDWNQGLAVSKTPRDA